MIAGADEVLAPASQDLIDHLYPALVHTNVVEGAPHLFQGQLDELREAVRSAAEALLGTGPNEHSPAIPPLRERGGGDDRHRDRNRDE